MTIQTVSTSNTFNEWRVITNELVTEVNKTESGTAVLVANTITANTITANGDIAVNGGDITTTQTTASVFNSTVTTLNVGGAATTVEIGAATGTTNINNDLDVDGDVNIDGGDLTVSTSTFNLANTNATTVNFAGAGTTVNIGANTGTTTVRNDLSVTGTTSLTGNVTLAGELRGPSTFTIDPAVVGDDTGTVVIKGNLQVDGTTTTINSTTLTVDDKNIVVASGAADSAAADGAGLTIDGANAQILYLHSGTKFNINKALELDSTLSVKGNTTLGDASGDTVTINASTVSIPNGLNFDSNTLVIDATNDRVGVGVSPSVKFHVAGSSIIANSTAIDPDSYSNAIVAGTVADGSGFSGLGIGFRQGNTGSTGAIVMSGGGMYFGIGDNSTANSITGMIDVTRSSITFNENSIDTDFRVESDTNTHALFVDAGNSYVGINHSSPLAELHVVGKFYQISPGTNPNYSLKRAVVVVDEGSTSTTRYQLVARIDFGTSWSAGNFPVITVSRIYRDNVTNYIKYALTGEDTLQIIEQFNCADVLRVKGPVTYNSNTGVYELWIVSDSYSAYQVLFEGNWNLDAIPTSPNSHAVEILTTTQAASTSTASAPSGLTQATVFYTAIFPAQSIVHNEYSADIDFRIESDTSTHALFVDAGSNWVTINSSSNHASSRLFVEGNITANYNQTIALRYNHATDNTQYYKGMTGTELSGGVSARGLHIFNYDQDSDLGINFWSGRPGTGTPLQLATFNSGLIVFNETSLDQDFRIESDASSHAFFVDAGNDVVVIGDNAGTAKLTIRKDSANTSFTSFAYPAYNSGIFVTNESSTNGAFSALTLSARNSSSFVQGVSFVAISNNANNYAPELAIVLQTGASSSTEYVRLDRSGNVGIGTNSPSTYGKLAVAGNIVPTSDNAYDLGSASYSWANVYTGDLHLSNMKKEQGNEVDGTKGDWTIQEGEDNLYIINNKNGKKYRFKLEEIQ